MNTKKIGFILSTGRTGTVLLRDVLSQHYQGWDVLHEPPGSRQQYLFGNFSRDNDLLRLFLAAWVKRSRKKYCSGSSEKSGYIEINPMLSSLADVLPRVVSPLHVVHIVRNPASWVTSMNNFRASERFRNIIQYVPFNHPVPSLKPANWGKLTEREVLIWRWRIYNENLSKLKEKCDRYLLVRFEDLTSNEEAISQASLKSIIQTLNMEKNPDVSWFVKPSKVNEYQHATETTFDNWSAHERETLFSICGKLMRDFGY